MGSLQAETPSADDNRRTTFDQVIVDIKDYVFHYEIENPRAWLYARTTMLDALGCAIESLHNSPECRSLLGPIVPGTAVPDGFRLPGTSYQLDPVKGAFDLGSMIRYSDHNDALGGADASHPSDNLGAILAVSDWLCRSAASGRVVHHGPPLTIHTVLTAMIKAYEIQGCFQIQNAFHPYGMDHTILVKLASTAVVSWLLGLSEEQTMAAVSHVFMDGCPLRVFRGAPNTIPRKGWAAGDACTRAVQLALLTKRGQPGGHTVLTSPRWGFYTNLWHGNTFALPKPYSTWVIENIFFKCIPAEGHGISAIEAALQQAARLRARGLDPAGDIESIDVRTQAAAVRIISKAGELHNAADRDHCMQYMIAVSLLKGEIMEVADYSNESKWATSQDVAMLRAKIKIREEESFTRDYLDLSKKSAASGITIVLKNGDVMDEVVVEYPIGHVENDNTLATVKAKFRRNMSLRFEEQEVEGILAAAENEDMAVSKFVDLLVRKGERENKL